MADNLTYQETKLANFYSEVARTLRENQGIDPGVLERYHPDKLPVKLDTNTPLVFT